MARPEHHRRNQGRRQDLDTPNRANVRQVRRFRMAKVYNNSLTLVRFVNTFQYPSEVYLISPGGKSNRIYRETTRNVTDVFWLGRFAMLAAIEPPGKLHQ